MRNIYFTLLIALIGTISLIDCKNSSRFIRNANNTTKTNDTKPLENNSRTKSDSNEIDKDNNNNTNHKLKCTKEYIAQAGDSCFLVGTEYGLSRAEFKRFNPHIRCKDLLQKGTKLCLRASIQRYKTSEEHLESLREIIHGRPVDDFEFRQHFDVKVRG